MIDSFGFVRASIVYTVFGIVNRAIPFVLVPILTRLLPESDYGTVTMFFTMISLFAPFVGLNLDSAVLRRYYDCNEEDFGKYVGNAFSVGLIVMTISLAFVFFFQAPFMRLSQLPLSYTLLLPVLLFVQLFSAIQLGMWRIGDQPFRFGAFQVGQTVVNLVLSLLLVGVLHLGWEGRVLGHTISVLVFCFLAFLVLYREGNFKLNINFSDTHHVLKFGLPLIPHELGLVALSVSDKLILSSYFGVGETGVYSVAFQFAAIVSIISISFNNAFLPWVFEQLKTGNKEKLKQVVSLIFYLSAGLLFIAAFLAWFVDLVLPYVVGSRFLGARVFLLPLFAGFACQGMNMLVSNLIFFSEKTYLLSISTLVIGPTSILVNYFFIRSNGALGAAQSFLICAFLSLVMNAILANYAMRKIQKNIWSKRDDPVA